jgi:uncharacterized protein YlxW (UPF0749 family)
MLMKFPRSIKPVPHIYLPPLKEVLTVFGCFILLSSLMIGGLLSLYQPFRFNTEAVPRYSTHEIVLVQQMNRRLHEIEAQNDVLDSEISLLNYKMAKQLRHLYHESYMDSYKKLEDLNGLRKKRDDGVEITLKDSSLPVSPGEDPNAGIVHNVDLLLIVNQLWAAGAKAISINDQRLVATSEISCAGPVITVNRTRVSSPFVIRAVGPVDKLSAQLEQDGSYLNYLASYGIDTHVEAKKLEIPAFSAAGFGT